MHDAAGVGSEDRLRVLLLSQTPGVGGAERVVLPALARARGLAVTVVGHESVCNFAAQLDFPARELSLPRAHRLTHLPRLSIGGWQIRALAGRLKSDVVYANGTRATVYGVASRLLGGPPLLVHHHGVLTTGPTRTFARAVERYAAEVVVPSEASRIGLSSPGARVVPTGIDIAHFTAAMDKASARSALGLPHVPVIGMITRADPRKGMRSFVRVAEIVSQVSPDVHFLLAGGATFPHEVPEYESIRAEASRLGDRITLTGFLPDPRLAFTAMDLFLHLSEPEALPTTLIEAQAAGVPAIAYSWGGACEIIVDGRTGRLVEPEAEAAADATVDALNDPAWRERAAAEGREYCREHFSLERFVEDLTAAISAATQARSAG